MAADALADATAGEENGWGGTSSDYPPSTREEDCFRRAMALITTAKSVLAEGKLPERDWHSIDPKYREALFHWAAAVAGAVDGVVENATDATQIVALLDALINDKAQRDAMVEAFSKLTPEQVLEMGRKMITDSYGKLTSSDEEVNQHAKGKVVSQAAVMLAGSGVGMIAKDFLVEVLEKGSKNVKSSSKELLELAASKSDGKLKVEGDVLKPVDPNDLSSKLGGDLLNDCASDPRLKEYMEDLAKNNPAKAKEMFEAWEVLKNAGVDDAVRKSPRAVEKVSRYLSKGYKIEKGGIVKQSDGSEVGKLDMNDPYNPGELKVKGKYSGRHFDPDDAGGIIKKLDWKQANIQSSGISDIEKHLSRFEDIDGDNAFMIDRLKKIQKGEMVATDYDKRFYTHELEEYSRYKNKGVPDGFNDEDFYYNAHTASLESYGVNEISSPLYYPKR